ncbi:GNAT family N-acetyltransferase [Nocardia sp. NPDC048505]|uniref:GNAT family N-acetyltransferase n=1 Tax=unclassified Nocardia TaxID=2637762 RepID=UPI0033F122ED
MFCDVELGARIERVETELIAAGNSAAQEREGRGFAIPVESGIASYASAGSPLNKVAGLGFGNVPSEAEFEEIEKRYAENDATVQVELSHLGNPAIGEMLTGRGYRLVSFENVLGLALNEHSERSAADGVTVRGSDENEFDVWIDTVVDGFARPDTQGVASHEEFPRDVLADAMRDLTAAAGVERFVAVRGDTVAGAASMRMSQGIAQLTGAATLPAHRRRGVQSALLSTRLQLAAAASCDIAVITTQPGSKSQQNAQRQGFDLLYTRAILIKE